MKISEVCTKEAERLIDLAVQAGRSEKSAAKAAATASELLKTAVLAERGDPAEKLIFSALPLISMFLGSSLKQPEAQPTVEIKPGPYETRRNRIRELEALKCGSAEQIEELAKLKQEEREDTLRMRRQMLAEEVFQHHCSTVVRECANAIYDIRDRPKDVEHIVKTVLAREFRQLEQLRELINSLDFASVI